MSERSLSTFCRDQYADWAGLAQRLGFSEFVSAEDGFRHCLLTGNKWTNADTSGIYFWVLDNDHGYIGQALQCRRRLLNHWKLYPNLSFAGFQPVPANNLDEVEERLIKEMCASDFPHINIKHALNTTAKVPFDNIVSEKEREHFLGGGTLPNEQWRDLPLLERRQARKFDLFENAGVAEHILPALKLYIERVFPCPAKTEARFWSCSLFVQKMHIVRVNVGQQEIFTLTIDDEGFIFARPLTQTRNDPDAGAPYYKTRSYENFVPLEELAQWLTGARLLDSRKLAVWLMRHTTTLNNGNHCPQLVRAAFR